MNETIKHQQDLLNTNRKTLAILLRQSTLQGVHVTTGVQHDIQARRKDIAKIKSYLRQQGVYVEDSPNDEDPDDFTSSSSGVPTTPLPVLYQVSFYGQMFFGRLIRDDSFRAIEVNEPSGLVMVIEGPAHLFLRVS